MRAVAAYDLDAPAAAHDHLVPGEQGRMGQRIAASSIKIDHHLGDAALGRRNAPRIGRQAELPPQRLEPHCPNIFTEA